MAISARLSLTRRTLLRVAVTAGIGIMAATGVTYLVVYDAMEKLRLEILSQYVVERAHREETRFFLAESNLQVVKEAFLQLPDFKWPKVAHAPLELPKH